MSRFITKIPVDIDALTKGVPKNTYIHSAILSEDRKSVDVEWDNPAFTSPVQGAWEFPVKNLQDGTLPDGVKLADSAKPVEKPLTPDVSESEGVGNKAVAETPAKRKKVS